MKKYTKTINGKQVIKPANKIVINKDGMNIFNPKEEMILADGWIEHISMPYEPTEEEILNREKEYKIEEILRHDSSYEVNCFYIEGQEIWLDKATRVGLKLRFDAEIACGRTNTILWYEGVSFNLELANAVQMLNAIEIYASACYDNTHFHISKINKMDNIEDIINYNYRDGYPEKLNF
jgi:hypothetical protein